MKKIINVNNGKTVKNINFFKTLTISKNTKFCFNGKIVKQKYKIL